jgi:pantothenate kinase
MSALAIREALNGHHKIAAVLSANIAVSAARDKAKTDLRDYAEEHSLPTNAKRWGKLKTLLHNIGMGIVIKSGRNNIAGKVIGTSLLSGGTLIGLHDYMLYRRYIRHEKARAGVL